MGSFITCRLHLSDNDKRGSFFFFRTTASSVLPCHSEMKCAQMTLLWTNIFSTFSLSPAGGQAQVGQASSLWSIGLVSPRFSIFLLSLEKLARSLHSHEFCPETGAGWLPCTSSYCHYLCDLPISTFYSLLQLICLIFENGLFFLSNKTVNMLQKDNALSH